MSLNHALVVAPMVYGPLALIEPPTDLKTDMSDIILVRVNCSSLGEAETIGRKIIAARLAACANIDGPVCSMYEWEGKLQSDEEFVLWLKTRTSLWPEAERLVLQLHSFETPAILAIPCQYANARYEAWLHSSTGRP